MVHVCITARAHCFPAYLYYVVPCPDYGDKENDDLREKYGVSAEDFPVFKMFTPSSSEPLTFSGDVISTDELKLWAKKSAGVRVGLKGALPTYDDIAEMLMQGKIKAEEAVLKGKAAMAGIKDETAKKTAELYVQHIQHCTCACAPVRLCARACAALPLSTASRRGGVLLHSIIERRPARGASRCRLPCPLCYSHSCAVDTLCRLRSVQVHWQHSCRDAGGHIAGVTYHSRSSLYHRTQA